ncbi:MAG: hypothetical protein HY903_17630 [Deltaproteobacteria bacterium]|nr:hypothetical protein [Deltaproteobacteria bacterium]
MLIAFGLLVALSSCGGDSLDMKPPFFAASTDVIDFGAVELGAQSEATLYVINKGDKALQLQTPSGNTLGGVFAVLLTQTQVSPLGDAVARVVFQPTSVASFETTMNIANDSTNQPAFAVQLKGVGKRGDPCAGVTCSTPPPSACLDYQTSRYFPPFGTCDAGHCTYTSTDVACPQGCDLDTGRCAGDLCRGVACQAPPNSCFGATGTCDDGACIYTALSGVVCNDSDPCTQTDRCQEGTCRGTPVSCNAPPAPICRDVHTQVRYDAVGICGTGGVCQYIPRDIPCPYGCVNGACQGDPCAGGCDDGNPCTRDSCQLPTGCVHEANNGAACTAGSGDCPVGQCVGSICMSVAGTTCAAEVNIDLCADTEIAGVCSANGSCVVEEVPAQLTCPGCPGICLQCYFIQLCIPLF